MNTQTTRPQSATEFLATAASTLGERGKQYDPAGKQERSMTAIVQAFNAIYPHNLLTVHMGWQFMSLVKMVRGATKPHADSALDQVAYAALAAECVAEQLNQPAALCEDEGCPHHGTPHVCVTSEVSYTSLQVSNQELAEELGKCQHLAGLQSQVLKHLTDKLAAQQELLRVAQHNANFYFDKTNSCIAANESMTAKFQAKFQAERKANVAMHEEVTRLRGEVQELAALAEYRDNRNAELCAELESQRGKCIAQSSRISELQTLVDNLRSSLAQATKEAPCAHNTDEPKAPRPEYVDPYDSHGDIRSTMHRLVGDRDPARGGLAYPQGKPL